MCVPGDCPFSLLPSLLAPVLGPHPSLPCPALPPHATQFKLNAKKMEQEANKCAALRKKFEAEALVSVKKNEMVRARATSARAAPAPLPAPLRSPASPLLPLFTLAYRLCLLLLRLPGCCPHPGWACHGAEEALCGPAQAVSAAGRSGGQAGGR